MSDNFKRLQYIVGQQLEVLTTEIHFIHDLGADLLDVVKLVIGIENEFDIEIEDQIATIQDALNYIQEKEQTKRF